MQSRKSWRTMRGRSIRQDACHSKMRIGSSSNAVPVTDGLTDWMYTHQMLPVEQVIGESMGFLVSQMGTLLATLTDGATRFGRLTTSCVTRFRSSRATN